jgi:DNA-binding NtrC family response regulator
MTFNAPFSGMNVLVVDDDRAIRLLITRIATGWSYDVVESPSAEDALAKLREKKFNIILTDIQMGKMDGITFAEKIREKLPSTAVIIMTGNPNPKTAKKSHDMGAIYYMQKPISMEELGETLKIAANWNLSMLVQRAAKRYLALRKGHERDHATRLKAIKEELKFVLQHKRWYEHVRDFVYAQSVETNPLFAELNQKFAPDSLRSF